MITGATLLDLYNGIADTSYVTIYWFFPALFCLYLSIPLFAAVKKSKRKEIFTYLAAAGFLIHCVGTYYSSMQAKEFIRTFKGYNSVPCMMYSVGIFVWLKYHSDRIMSNRIVSMIVNFIAPYSFGIYLLQFFIYSTMISVFGIDVRSMLYRLGAPFVIIPIAILIISVLRKIPVVRNIVP